MQKIVVIGSGMAGYSVVTELRKTSGKFDITVITTEDGAHYSKPMLSRHLSLKTKRDRMIIATSEKAAEKYDCKILSNTEVTEINNKLRILTLSNGSYIEFDYLVLAIGANCRVLQLPNHYNRQIHTINSLREYLVLRDIMSPQDKVLVIGGGLVGCEITNDLIISGYNVSLLCKSEKLLDSLLPEKGSDLLCDKFLHSGVKVILGQDLNDECIQKCGIASSTEEFLNSFDHIISAVGLVPNIHLAERSGIKTNYGILVDNMMRTSEANIFALGDCAEICGRSLMYCEPIRLAAKVIAEQIANNEGSFQLQYISVKLKTSIFPVTIYCTGSLASSTHQETITEDGYSMENFDSNGHMISACYMGTLSNKKFDVTSHEIYVVA